MKLKLLGHFEGDAEQTRRHCAHPITTSSTATTTTTTTVNIITKASTTKAKYIKVKS